jgi:CheY-like chemotaxis protein
MNSLLIHNDNLPTSLINAFNNHFKFSIGQAKILEFDFSFDKEAHDQLISSFKAKSFDTIFIPYSLSVNNYLELSGLRLALHIRLTEELRHRNTPIVFIGHETKDQIAKLTDYGGFLFSSGIFNTTKFKYDQLQEQHNWIVNSWKPNCDALLSRQEYQSFLSRIKINPSASHQSHHSLINEWAMYRWAKALGDIGKENEELGLINKIVTTDLYFKYLISINEIKSLKDDRSCDLEIKNKGKILLIDDEANKGWYEIFCTLLHDINQDMIEFDYVDDYSFRHKTQEDIIEICKNKIREVKGFPDVVILDLRIHPIDFGDNSINEMTGFKLLTEIKNLNPGIQVVIFSATDKVWNLQALQKAGADGFIHKESFENSSNNDFTFESIENMVSTLNSCLIRKFLKSIYFKCKQINEFLKACDYVDDTPFEEFLNDLKKHLKLIEVSVGNIDLDDSMTLDIVFLNCYNFLEKFNKYYIKYKENQFVLGIDEVEMNRYKYVSGGVLNEGRFIRNTYNDSPSWFQGMIGIYLDYFKNSDLESREVNIINTLKNLRNDYIHGKKKQFNQKELGKIFDLMIDLTAVMKE